MKNMFCPPLKALLPISYIVFMLLFSHLSFSQGNQPMWRLGGNSVGQNDFLGTTNNQSLVFKSNGMEGFRLLPDGNVGIGTTTPQAKLDVNGNVIVRGWLWAMDGVVVGKKFEGGRADIDTLKSKQLESDKMRSSNIIIEGNNNRIYSTSGFLDFGNNNLTNINTLQVANLQSDNTNFSFLWVTDSLKVGTNSIIIGGVSQGGPNTIYSDDGDLSIQCNPNNYNTIINQNDGFVGIGTVDPKKKLHILHEKTLILEGVESPYEKLNTTKTIDTTLVPIKQEMLDEEVIDYFAQGSMRIETILKYYNNARSAWDIQPLAPIFSSNTRLLSFSDAVHNKTIMVMSSDGKNGRVGIGTLQPRQQLQVHNGGILLSGANSAIYFHQSWNANASFGDQGNYSIEYLPASTIGGNLGGLNFWKPYGSIGGYKDFVLHIADNGNVGIGTGNPGATFHIKHTGLAWSFGFILDVADNDVQNPSKAFTIRNSETGTELFRVWGNGVVNAQTIWAEQVKVRTTPVVGHYHWPDFVFCESYELMPLKEVEEYIKENKKLPGVPSEDEVKKDGVNLYEIDVMLLQKIEELTLYIIQLENRVLELENK